MKMVRGSKQSVFMVINSNVKIGVPEISSFVRTQINSLRHVGWEIFIGVLDDRTSLSGIIRNTWRLRREISQTQPGLVHAQYGSVTAFITCLVQGRRPLVISFCGDDLLGTPNPGVVWRFREWCARIFGLIAAWKADAIIVKSKNLFQRLPGPLRAKTMIIPNGVDLNWFQPLDRVFSRVTLGWNTKEKIILFNAGEDTNQNVKNLPLAREVVKILSQNNEAVNMKILSNADREEVRWMLNAADCLLVTSLHEGSPNIVKEAMACNLPIVSVPCGDVGDRLRLTIPGKVCPYDIRALAGAIQEVLSADCRSNGREQILAQGLTAENVTEPLTKIYEGVQNHCQEGGLTKACVE